jgi:multiple sugar transport system permease protein/raffinose/stachyose/melibiose transport system permease protein
LTFYVAVVVAPLLYSFYYSLTDWNGFSARYNYVGTENFEKILRDPVFSNAIENTVIWMIAAIIVPTGGGLLLALLLHEGVRAASLYKSLFYFPISLSLAVIGQVWIWIYQPRWGLLNVTLREIGLDHYARAWLARPESALPAIIGAWSWQQIGLAMVIFLAGLTSVPTELTEAAQIDGANRRQSLRHVVIPLLRPASIVVIALAVINSLKSFDVVYVMTKGGPFHSSDTLAIFVYNECFQKYYMGYGSAAAVVLFMIALIMVAFYFFWQMRSLESMYD